MIDVEPQKPGEPKLRLYETPQDLQAATGMHYSHGYFDPRENLIVATVHSVAHEIGHYKDWQSGRMKSTLGDLSPIQKAEAKMRNEIVAILFARTKHSSCEFFLEYERDFLEWFECLRAQGHFGPQRQKEIQEWSLTEIQDFAEDVTAQTNSWFEKLEYIFRGYLQDQHLPLTYSVKPKRRKYQG